jgi:hypothetical protein
VHNYTPYTFVTKPLVPLLHVYTVYVHYTLIFTALSHIMSPNLLNASSLDDFSAIGYFYRLSHTVAHAKSSLHTANSRRDLTPRIHCFLNTDFFTVTPGTELNRLIASLIQPSFVSGIIAAVVAVFRSTVLLRHVCPCSLTRWRIVSWQPSKHMWRHRASCAAALGAEPCLPAGA